MQNCVIPLDIVRVIYDHLDLPDAHRYRRVCKAWDQIGRDLPRGLPAYPYLKTLRERYPPHEILSAAGHTPIDAIFDYLNNRWVIVRSIAAQPTCLSVLLAHEKTSETALPKIDKEWILQPRTDPKTTFERVAFCSEFAHLFDGKVIRIEWNFRLYVSAVCVMYVNMLSSSAAPEIKLCDTHEEAVLYELSLHGISGLTLPLQFDVIDTFHVWKDTVMVKWGEEVWQLKCGSKSLELKPGITCGMSTLGWKKKKYALVWEYKASFSISVFHVFNLETMEQVKLADILPDRPASEGSPGERRSPPSVAIGDDGLLYLSRTRDLRDGGKMLFFEVLNLATRKVVRRYGLASFSGTAHQRFFVPGSQNRIYGLQRESSYGQCTVTLHSFMGTCERPEEAVVPAALTDAGEEDANAGSRCSIS